MFIEEIGHKKYDIAIVGAGPAGISLALGLVAHTKARILLIESGTLEINPEIHKLSEVEASGDLPSDYYPTHAQRVFGGTSNVWNGLCVTLEERAFLNKEWAIDYKDISAYYKDAAEILELREESYKQPKMILDNGTGDLIYKPYYLSPPVRFCDKYFHDLSAHRNIDILLNSTCTKIISNRSMVTGLLIKESDCTSISSYNVKAEYYVLACGGIGNARIMQLGGISTKSPVGKYFMDHPHISGTTSVELDKETIEPFLVDGRVIHALQLSDKCCLKNSILNISVDFGINSVERKLFMGRKRSVYVSDAVIRAEMAPSVTNRIYLGEQIDALAQEKTRIHFNFNYQSLAKTSWNLFAQKLLSSGIGRATTPPEFFHDIKGGGHYIGTTRMGVSATSSVVDSDCKVHGIDNLYVAGSSIFPASAAANPTFSIVAFSLRLANHLAMRLRGRNLL
jgi:choline dehydrogenase-like flavoprotein